MTALDPQKAVLGSPVNRSSEPVEWRGTGVKPYYSEDGITIYHGDCRIYMLQYRLCDQDQRSAINSQKSTFPNASAALILKTFNAGCDVGNVDLLGCMMDRRALLRFARCVVLRKRLDPGRASAVSIWQTTPNGAWHSRRGSKPTVANTRRPARRGCGNPSLRSSANPRIPIACHVVVMTCGSLRSITKMAAAERNMRRKSPPPFTGTSQCCAGLLTISNCSAGSATQSTTSFSSMARFRLRSHGN